MKSIDISQVAKMTLLIAALFFMLPGISVATSVEDIVVGQPGIEYYYLLPPAAGEEAKLDRGAAPLEFEFDAAVPGEAFLLVEMMSPDTSWKSRASKSVVLSTSLDGQRGADIVLFGGPEFIEYSALLGNVSEGEHGVELKFDAGRSPAPDAVVMVREVRVKVVASQGGCGVNELSPVLWLGEGGAVNDIPLLFFAYERGDGRRTLEYQVIFSNEDGGTGRAPAKLSVEYGRTTDIEWMYIADCDTGSGKITRGIFQGAGHATTDFSGERFGTHPVLRVATSNGNFSDRGRGEIMVSPAPLLVNMPGLPREALMDAFPWTYRIMTEEMFSEWKAAKPGDPDSPLLSDARNYVYIDFHAMNHTGRKSLAFEVKLRGGKRWYTSNPDEKNILVDVEGLIGGAGYKRTNVELPPGARQRHVEAIRIMGTPDVDYTIYSLSAFMLGKDYAPLPPFIKHDAEIRLTPENREYVIKAGD